MPVDSSPRPEQAASAPINTPPVSAYQPVDSEFEQRWAAWVARGRQHDLAVQRKLRLALIAGAVVLVLGAVLFRLFGGGL
jgi:hypothetical protein